jgi:hypothetical protein
MFSRYSPVAAWMLLVALACPSPGGAAQELLPEGTSLVLARVASVQVRGPIHSGKLHMTHVFCGATALTGESFLALSAESLQQGNETPLTPPLEVGERGIWLVRGRKGEVQPLSWDLHGLSWPVRERDLRFARATSIAEMLETLSGTAESGRVERLEEFARAPDTPRAAAAIRLLAKSASEAAARVLESLVARKELAVLAQVALDEALSERKAESWQACDARKAMLTTWVKGKLSEDEAEAVVTRLDLLAQHGGIDEGFLLGLLGSMVENAGLPLGPRTRALASIGWAFSRFADASSAFAYLVDRVEHSGEAPIRLGAARELLKPGALDSAARASRVRALLDRVEDRAVRKLLEQALERARQAPREEGQR